MKNKTNGITLIALVITIVVLLILAGVSIAMLTGENGILTQAQKAKNETENAAQNEAARLDEYNNVLNKHSNGSYSEGNTIGGLDTVTGAETSNTTVQDSLENKVVVPAGFKVVNPTDNVEDGIVIVDDDESRPTFGSEFVWIPVGPIHTSTGNKTITLGRYDFDSTTGEPSKFSESYTTEDTVAEHTYDNIPAKDITTFISKVNSTGGYYLGRFEARDGVTELARTDTTSTTNQLVCTANNYVYNYVTQSQAANLSRNMYSDNNFESDLVNSYAWDTAIVFIQNCSAQTNYANQTSLNTSLSTTGTTNDNPCNIYDMASNCREWTTETNSDAENPHVFRGGCYAFSYINTAGRGSFFSESPGDDDTTFRPILYL